MGHSSISIKARRRKVANLAAYSRQHSVKNCTIPKNIVNNAIWDANKWYAEMRENAKKAIKEDKQYKYKGKRKPWYMLDTRKRKHYEEHKESWGTRTDCFRVPSEAAVLYNKTVFVPKGKAWYMEALVQHKLARWERKNPCPVKTDGDQHDLFEKEFLVPWEESREKALERIRDFVVSVYDKLPLEGRFKKSETKYEEKKIADIKDINGEGHKVNELDPKKSKLLKKAQAETNKVHAKNNNLVCTNLKDHKRQKGRIILPKAA